MSPAAIGLAGDQCKDAFTCAAGSNMNSNGITARLAAASW